MTDNGTHERYVSKEQFGAHISHIEQRFGGLEDFLKTMSGDIRGLATQLSQVGQPKYGNWFAMLGVLVVMVGMAGALIDNSIKAASALHDSHVERLQMQIDLQYRADLETAAAIAEIRNHNTDHTRAIATLQSTRGHTAARQSVPILPLRQ